MGARLSTRPRVAKRSSRGMNRTDTGARSTVERELVLSASAATVKVAHARAHSAITRASTWRARGPCANGERGPRLLAATFSRRPRFPRAAIDSIDRRGLHLGQMCSRPTAAAEVANIAVMFTEIAARLVCASSLLQQSVNRTTLLQYNSSQYRTVTSLGLGRFLAQSGPWVPPSECAG